MRKKSEELEQIKKQLNCSRLWSWSRIALYINDPYSYMLRYILKIPEDKNDSIYAISGNYAHELMENFYKGKVDNQGMLEKYEEKLFEYNTMGLMYDRTDKDKNEKIAKKYEACLRHYFLNHKRITDKPIIEPFILIKIGNQFFNGYIDFINVEERDGRKKVFISDWKTSSLYSGKKLIENSGQLLLYAEGIHQKTNMPYEDIIIRFNFMKYVNVTYTQKNGEIKVRQIERNSIGEKLKSNTKTWLKHFKYSEDDIENLLFQMIETNTIECLPKEVQEKFKINDCFVEVKLNEEIIDNHKQYITNIIVDIIKKEKEFEKTKDKNIFWKDITRESSYYHAVLSGYSSKIHEPYRKYLEELDDKDSKRVEKDKSIIDDLSWLDGIL